MLQQHTVVFELNSSTISLSQAVLFHSFFIFNFIFLQICHLDIHTRQKTQKQRQDTRPKNRNSNTSTRTTTKKSWIRRHQIKSKKIKKRRSVCACVGCTHVHIICPIPCFQSTLSPVYILQIFYIPLFQTTICYAYKPFHFKSFIVLYHKFSSGVLGCFLVFVSCFSVVRCNILKTFPSFVFILFWILIPYQSKWFLDVKNVYSGFSYLYPWRLYCWAS